MSSTTGGVTTYRDLAPLDGRLVARNVAYLAGIWATIVAAATVAAWRPGWWTLPLAALVISGRQHALLNVEHECIHNMFVRGGKRRNDAIGRWLCAAPSGSPYSTAKATHLQHHRLLARDGDPDAELHAGDDKRTRRGLRTYFLTGLLGGYALRALVQRGGDAGVANRAAPADLVSIVVAHSTLWLASGVTLGWWVYPALWAAPLVTLTPFWHLVRSFTEHAVTEGEQAAHADRLVTTTSHPLELFCLAPYNMNHHAEHHLHPFVPAPRLPEVRRRMADDAGAPPVLVRSSYLGALRDHYRSLP